jgi:hypothetical protein
MRSLMAEACWVHSEAIWLAEIVNSNNGTVWEADR